MSGSVVVIGAGPAGVEAACLVSDFGCAVTLIESAQIGGTCLNTGCIPSKYFLHYAKLWRTGVDFTQNYGSSLKYPIQMFWDTIVRDSVGIISNIREVVAKKLKSKKIRLVSGVASFRSHNTITIDSVNEQETVVFDCAIIASGTQMSIPECFSHCASQFLTTETVFFLSTFPKSIAIIGAGSVGCEFTSFFSALGSSVHLIEQSLDIMPLEDALVRRMIRHAFKKKKVNMHLNTQIQSIQYSSQTSFWTIHLSDDTHISVEQVLLATGRKMNYDQLNIDCLDLVLNSAGYIHVNSFFQTNQSHVYTVGDANGISCYAHAASSQAKIAVKHIFNRSFQTFDIQKIPRCLYTEPESASIGMISESVKPEQYSIKRFFFKALPMAIVNHSTEGVLQVIYDRNSFQIKGVQIVGQYATEMINMFSVCMYKDVKLNEFESIVLAHPTFSESIQLFIDYNLKKK